MVRTLLLLLILCRLPVLAQEKDALSNLKQQSSEMGAAFIKGDYKTFSRYTYPKIVTMAGGPARMAESLAQMVGGMKQKGMTFVSLTFDEPSKIVLAGAEW